MTVSTESSRSHSHRIVHHIYPASAGFGQGGVVVPRYKPANDSGYRRPSHARSEPARQPLRGERALKDVIDRAGAAVALLLLSPVFFVLAWKIKRDGGPAFYGHTRIGRNDKAFKCWKFRSMVMNSQAILKELLANDPAARAEYEKDFKLKNDPRVTRIGALLRKTSLDEIPQLFNVLRGEMSLVGPRPIVEDEKRYYGDKIDLYTSVKPGITGLWQVSGRSDTGYDLRVQLDNSYIKNWSLLNDIVIIFKTIHVVLTRKGAY
jgi:Undecaprenyl-phosphate galactose phosphotransferase WbaP